MTIEPPRVYLVQEPLKMTQSGPVPRINYGTLKPYGSIHFLFSWSELVGAEALENAPAYMWELRSRLRDFRTSDYLVLMGNPVLCAIAVNIAAELNRGKVTVLDWMKDPGAYRVVALDFNAPLRAVREA
jgi:hypothetical protein